jgi:hypothetical protein
MSWVKVPISQDDHKTLHNLPRGFDTYLVDIKTMSKIAQVFVTFSEKLNFNSCNYIKSHNLHNCFFKKCHSLG